MEVSRFHRAIEQIANDYKKNGVESELASLAANLASLSANPGNPGVSQSFKDQLNAFREKLSASPLNQADSELLETITSHELTPFVADGLFQSVKKILDDNQLTPNLAATEIEKLRAAVIEKLNIVVAIDKAFTELQVDYYKLDDGESEMLINLPMESETKTLEDLAKEVKDWHQICRAISETFDANQDPITIRTIGTGSILLYLAATGAFIYGVAKCLKGINSILAEVIKMKGLYNQLVESKAPKSVIDGLEQHQAGKAKADLERLAADLVDEYYKGDDPGRKNELKTSLSISLQRLSTKLATGAKVNLRIAPPKRPKIEDGIALSPEENRVLQTIEQFEKVQIEIDSSKAALDYNTHAPDLIASLPGPTSQANPGAE